MLYAAFVDSNNATVARVADHIEHIASVCGRDHVGLGSDFDGISASVLGMEDASKWPNMVSGLFCAPVDHDRYKSLSTEAGQIKKSPV